MSIVDEREKTHGPFERTAEVHCRLRGAIVGVGLESRFTPVQGVALDMILHKIARIASGDPDEPDHWRDIAGYCELALRSLK